MGRGEVRNPTREQVLEAELIQTREDLHKAVTLLRQWIIYGVMLGHLSIRAPYEMLDDLKAIAESQQRPFAQIVRFALEEYLETHAVDDD